LPSSVYESIRQQRDPESYAGEEREEIKNQITTETLETIADMQQTADELKAGLRLLSGDFVSVFSRGEAYNARIRIEGKVNNYSQQLSERVYTEIPSLPIASKMTMGDKQKMSYLLQAQKQYRYGRAKKGAEGAIKRLEKAEKFAEKFVTAKLQQVKEIPPGEYISGLQASAEYLRNLWDRLNGGGTLSPTSLLPPDLPRPLSTSEESKTNMSELVIEVEKLEKSVKEASKAREAKLQKASSRDRLSLAFQLKMMDDEVLQLTRLLAVRSLQLQMEYIYQTLEEEALDVVENPSSPGYVRRQGSSEELLLLTAEFALLDEQLRTLMKRLTESSTILVGDTILQTLVDEIEDLRKRLGINSDVVFGDSRLTWRKATLQAEKAVETIQEGVNFLVRGVRLMGTDLLYASRLFSKAALGGTLKPREVTALRRTARDILAFIPFAAILVIPLTPVGHVLVFGFLQRYFPEVFPSQFTNRRQDIMNKYDILRDQLKIAQEKASQAEEEEELARASEVVARLTAPISEKQKIRLREALRRMSGDDYENKSQEELLNELEAKVKTAEMDTLDMEEDESYSK